MTWMRARACAMAAALGLGACATAPEAVKEAAVGEALLDDTPADYWDVIKIREELAKAGAPEHIGIEDALWKKSPVTVAFNGGNDEVYKIIEATAQEWTAHSENFRFSFRNPDGTFRIWPATDGKRADIRISFNENGYWSLIGSFALARASGATMNFYNFPETLRPHYGFPDPAAWKRTYYRATILHEFGHALGLNHEHFHKACQADMKFDPDPGYAETLIDGRYVPDTEGRSPGVLLYYKGEPNKWQPRSKILLQMEREMFLAQTTLFANMERFAEGDLELTESAGVDQKSVMLYSLQRYLLKGGPSSPCIAAGDGDLGGGRRFGAGLSAGDIAYFRENYP